MSINILSYAKLTKHKINLNNIKKYIKIAVHF